MRVAKTRAVNRPLRKAYGIGLRSVEELEVSSRPPNSSSGHEELAKSRRDNGSNNGQRASLSGSTTSIRLWLRHTPQISVVRKLSTTSN
jgi:hypothetical protein